MAKVKLEKVHVHMCTVTFVGNDAGVSLVLATIARITAAKVHTVKNVSLL